MELYEIDKKNIIAQCQHTQTLFVDKEFTATTSSLYKDSAKIPDFAKEIKQIKWLRPHEIQKDAKFMLDIEGDYKQGAFGESWFIGSLVIIGQLKK